MFPYQFQPGFEAGDVTSDQTPIAFQPGLAGSAQAHATGRVTRTSTCLARQVGPQTGQARQAIFVLGQFDLELTFPRVRISWYKCHRLLLTLAEPHIM